MYNESIVVYVCVCKCGCIYTLHTHTFKQVEEYYIGV